MPERQWGVAPADDPTGSILRKATGISAQPDPSWSRKFLELVTGYPSNPMSKTEPTDVMGAGLPFLNILGAGGMIGHGTQKVFDYFNNKHNDTSDVLGWLSHGAEDIPYATQYAGGMKGKFVDLNTKNVIHPHELTGYSGDKLAPRMIPIQLHNKNTLDLVNPNPDDISHALASLEPYERKSLIESFKDARRRLYSGEAHKEEFLPNRHYDEPGNIPMNEVPLRHVAENLRMTPETFAKSPFDAIRYRDTKQKAWAFPDTTPAKTPWGVDVTNPPKPIQVIKTDKPSGGILEVHPDRWEDPGALAAQLKTNPDMKLTGAQIEKLYYDNKITGKQKYNLYKNNVMSSSEQVAGMKLSKSWDELSNKEKINWKPGEEKYKGGYFAHSQTTPEGIPYFAGAPIKEDSLKMLHHHGHVNDEEFNSVMQKFAKPSDELDSILGPKLKEKYTEKKTAEEWGKQSLIDQMTSYGLNNDSADYLSSLVTEMGKKNFTPEQINKLSIEHALTPNEVNYLQHNHSIHKPEPPKGNLTQSEVDDLLAKHQPTKYKIGDKLTITPKSGGEPFNVNLKNQFDLNELDHYISGGSKIEHTTLPKTNQSTLISQNTPNGPIKGVQTNEGHFIPDSKMHPNEWADKILELNPHYDEKKIGDIYTNGAISQHEYNALWNAKQKQNDNLAHEWLTKNMDLSSGIAYGGHYNAISKAVKKGEVSPDVWGVYNKLVGGK